MWYLLIFYYNNGCMNAPQCYVICTLPVLFIILICDVYSSQMSKFLDILKKCFFLRHKIYHMYPHSSVSNYHQNYSGGKVYWSEFFANCVCNAVWRKWFFYSKIIIPEVQILLPNFLQLWLYVPWTVISTVTAVCESGPVIFQWLTPSFCQLTSMFLTTKHYALLNDFLAAVDMIHEKSEFFPPAAVGWPCCYK